MCVLTLKKIDQLLRFLQLFFCKLLSSRKVQKVVVLAKMVKTKLVRVSYDDRVGYASKGNKVGHGSKDDNADHVTNLHVKAWIISTR